MSLNHRRVAFTIRLLLLAIVLPLAACKKSETPEKPSISVFASPDNAGNALLAAERSGDQNALLALFGPDSKQVIYSGDAVEDKNAADAFVARYGVMHRWRKLPDDSLGLLVGADNFPFPIPLKKNNDGKWFFDTAAGREEVLNRRIGGNELAIIEVCRAVADAQGEYFSRPRDGEKTKQFAVKFLSDPGRQNGLYWKSAEGQPASPLGPLAANASAEGYRANPEGSHTTFHGYNFRMLTGQTDKAPGGAKDYVVNGKMTGGFAFVAYPAEHGNSGVMTFMINQDGVLLQKDLGKNTTEIAAAMTRFDPDPGWTIVAQ
ncbi:DUF2950 domain-containing protein [Edaphobacter aggregans]|uniref:DUF2950 domain-containing protein n=1 Tax=Edaphobacter aggregans TaxID=570835 RepID=UPI000556F7DA|nr:DUF2950 domain-containing protein [Edaphobacter aggregans]